MKHSKHRSLQYYGVTRGQLPQMAGSLGLTAVGLDTTLYISIIFCTHQHNTAGLEIIKKRGKNYCND